MTLEQFGTAAAQVLQHVEALGQHLFLCRQAFSEGLAEAAALNNAQLALYQMDVGGAPFHTCTEVLHRHESMLSAMASDDFSRDLEGGGCAFLDRDPKWFPLVLHFMRTGAALLPEDAEGRAAVLREAQYYSLEGLCRLLQPLQERLIVMGALPLNLHLGPTTCQMYDPLRDSWERMEVDMGHLPANSDYCAGDGCIFAWAPYRDRPRGAVSRFDPSAGSWEDIAHATPIMDFCWTFACDNGQLYGTFDDRVQSLNVSTGQWKEFPLLSENRYAATPCVVDGRLFIIGGDTASVEEYVALEQRWVSVPDMPRAVTGAAAVALDGKLLVIGGTSGPDGNNRLRSAVVEYDPGDRSWKELPSLLTARAFCTAVVLGGDVVVMGGSNDDGVSVLVDRYNRQSQCWEAMASQPVTFLSSAAAVIRV